jgi:hypothetical protein
LLKLAKIDFTGEHQQCVALIGGRVLCMSKKRIDDISDLTALPEWGVLTNAQAARAMGISKDTLRRLDEAGQGPPIVRLSKRKQGRTIASLKAWTAARSS